MRKLAGVRMVAGLVAVAALATGLGACGGGSGNSTSAFCKKAKDLNNDKSLDNIASSNDPKQVQSDLNKLKSALDDLKNKAPSEIKADMNTVVGAVDEFATELQRVNGDFSKMDPSKIDKANSQQFQDASDRIDKFAQDKCGIKLNS